MQIFYLIDLVFKRLTKFVNIVSFGLIYSSKASIMAKPEITENSVRKFIEENGGSGNVCNFLFTVIELDSLTGL